MPAANLTGTHGGHSPPYNVTNGQHHAPYNGPSVYSSRSISALMLSIAGSVYCSAK